MQDEGVWLVQEWLCGCVERFWVSRMQPGWQEVHTSQYACEPTRCDQCKATKTGRWCHVKWAQQPMVEHSLQALAEAGEAAKVGRRRK